MGVPTDKISNRILIFFCCWCLLALPIHYFTCSVERNAIPLLNSVLNKNVEFSIEINLHCISHKSQPFCININNDASNYIQLQFNNSENIYNQFKLNINEYKHSSNHILERCESEYANISYLYCLQSISQQIENKIGSYGSYDIYLIEKENTNGNNKWIISPYRSAWIHINKIDENIFNALMNKMIYARINRINHHAKIGIKNQMFSFTLLNSEPEIGYIFKWNMTQIYNNYLLPFFNRINNTLIYNFYIDSQILYYGYLISHPPTDNIHTNTVNRNDFNTVLSNYIKKDNNYFYVTNKELQTFVGGTDWNRISSLINDIIPVEFVIYIPPKKYLPLHIKANINAIVKRNNYDAFLVPRFGGVVVYNPLQTLQTLHNNSNTLINTNDLYSTFNLVISQLRLLFGLTNNHNHHDMYLHFIMDQSGINEWELDILIRNDIINDLQTVEISLKNIYAMIDKISQLPIKMDVASLITEAIYAFDQALKSCHHDNNNNNNDDNLKTLKILKCIQWARHSNYLAKKAEYHHSMLPALYFSPEFTYAVYSPYFLPGYIPIIAALFKKLRAKYKGFRKKSKFVR